MLEIGLLKRIIQEIEDNFGENPKMIYQFAVKKSVKEDLSQLDSVIYDNYSDLKLIATIINQIDILKTIKFDSKEKGLFFHL